MSGREIRFAHFGSHEDDEFWRMVIADFERDNPGARVHQEYVDGLGDQYDIIMRRQIISDTLPDVALIGLATFRELADHFEDLGKLFESASQQDVDISGAGQERQTLSVIRHLPLISALQPMGLEAFEFGNAQRGLPVSGRDLLIYLNRRCFERAAQFHNRPVPLPADDWTIDDFIRTAEMLTCDFDRDGRIDQFGFRLPRWGDYLPFVWSFGADVTDAQMARWTFAGPHAQAAIRFYRQLATGDRVCPRDDEVSQPSQDADFLAGRTAMCINEPWFMSILDDTDLAGAYAVVPIPSGPGGRATRITWDGVVMKRGLKLPRRDVAWRFIATMLSQKVQDRLAGSGRAIPARTESQLAYAAVNPSRRRPFIEAVSYSRLPPTLPGCNALDRIINRHFAEVADPTRPFRAELVLDAMARDSEIIRAFAAPENKAP